MDSTWRVALKVALCHPYASAHMHEHLHVCVPNTNTCMHSHKPKLMISHFMRPLCLNSHIALVRILSDFCRLFTCGASTMAYGTHSVSNSFPHAYLDWCFSAYFCHLYLERSPLNWLLLKALHMARAYHNRLRSCKDVCVNQQRLQGFPAKASWTIIHIRLCCQYFWNHGCVWQTGGKRDT